MSVGLLVVRLKYGLYFVGHLSKLAFHFMFKVVRLVVVVSSFRLAGNGQVLLQVGYFITSSPEPLPNLKYKVEVNNKKPN